MTLAIFYLQVTPILRIKFRVNEPFYSGEEVQNRFSRWPSCISDRMILAIFDLPVTPILPNKFRVIWPFGSGEEGKNRFSRWPPWPNNFSYFLSTSHSKASYAGSRPFDSGEEVNKRAMMALYRSPEQHSTLRAWSRTDQGKHSDQSSKRLY